MRLSIDRGTNSGAAYQWEEHAYTVLPVAAPEVEELSGLMLPEEVHVRLLPKKEYQNYRIDEALAQGISRNMAYRMGAILTYVAPIVTDNFNDTPTIHVNADIYRISIRGEVPVFCYADPLVHELVHTAQQLIRAWGDSASVEAPDPEDPPVLGALNEGHAEWVASRWMERHYPGMNTRDTLNGLPARLFAKRIRSNVSKSAGISADYNNYFRGMDFIRAVFEERGLSGVNRMWRSIDHIPRESEIGDPKKWMKRIDSYEG
jgi:hypothetical protein